METRNLTIMFTDIKGFTERTSESSRQGMKQLLDEHDRLLIPVFQYFDGRIVKTIGDAFLVTFESPTDAVLCGVTIQEVLRIYNAKADEKNKLEVRVAINVGEVEIKENDVFGEAVNIAARLEGVTESGEVYFTDAVYQTMNRSEAPSAEVGERLFKGIPHPIRVYKVINDPNSDLSKNLVQGVHLSDKGVVITGLRDRIAAQHRPLIGRRMAWTAAAVVLLLVTLLLMLPSGTERTLITARELISGNNSLEAIAILKPKYEDDRANLRIKAVLIDAIRAHLEELKQAQQYQQAYSWLEQQLTQFPTLQALQEELAILDSYVTVEALKNHPQQLRYFQPEGLQQLLQRHDHRPAISMAAEQALGQHGDAMTHLWLFEESLKNGQPPDERIYQFCIKQLEQGGLFYPLRENSWKMLLGYYPQRARQWAYQSLDGSNALAYYNAWSMLEEASDPIIEQPLYAMLHQLMHGYETRLPARSRDIISTEARPEQRSNIIGLLTDIEKNNPTAITSLNKRKEISALLSSLKKGWAI